MGVLGCGYVCILCEGVVGYGYRPVLIMKGRQALKIVCYLC